MSLGPAEMDERVARLKTVQDCEQFAKNALARNRPDLANQARRRAIQLRADTHNAKTRPERECFEAMYAYEDVLTAKLRRVVRISPMWQTISRRGVVHAVERAVTRGTEIAYHATLREMGLQDLAFEAVVLRHPEPFSMQTVQRATKRVSEWKQPAAGASTSSGSTTRSGSAAPPLEAGTERYETAQSVGVQEPMPAPIEGASRVESR